MQEWPAPEADPPDLDAVRALLDDVAAEVERLVFTDAAFPSDYAAQDDLMRKYGRIRRMIGNRDRDRPAELMAVLRQFTGGKTDKRKWPGGPDQAKVAADQLLDHRRVAKNRSRSSA